MEKKTRHVAVMAGVFGVAVLMVLGSLPQAFAQPKLPPEAADWTYIGNSQCKVCHNSAKEGEQYKKWQEAKHSKAIEALKTDRAKEIAAEKGLEKPPHEAPECLKCHVTGYDVTAAAAPAKIKIEDGVQCESCHGPASEHLTLARKLKFKPEMITEIDIKATHIEPTEATCRSCHNEESPTWDTERYTLEDGTKTGFDFRQASEKINHGYPEGAMEEKYGGKYPTE